MSHCIIHGDHEAELSSAFRVQGIEIAIHNDSSCGSVCQVNLQGKLN